MLQIKPHPTKYHYPLITYLRKHVSSSFLHILLVTNRQLDIKHDSIYWTYFHWNDIFRGYCSLVFLDFDYFCFVHVFSKCEQFWHWTPNLNDASDIWRYIFLWWWPTSNHLYPRFCLGMNASFINFLQNYYATEPPGEDVDSLDLYQIDVCN